jgi:hypothetical protein
MEQESRGGEDTGWYRRIISMGIELKRFILRRRLKDILRGEPYTESQVQRIASEHPSGSMTPRRVALLFPHIKEDEEVEHVLQVQSDLSGLEISGGASTKQRGGSMLNPFAQMNSNMLPNFLATTDEHVIILFTQMSGDDVYHIKHASITSVEYERGIPNKVIISTHGRSYNLDVTEPTKERLPGIGRNRDEFRKDVEDILFRIREKASEANVAEPSTQSTTTSDASSADTIEQLGRMFGIGQNAGEDTVDRATEPPSQSTATGDVSGSDTIEQLERLQQLRDDGALTDGEFEDQKQELLEDE